METLAYCFTPAFWIFSVLAKQFIFRFVRIHRFFWTPGRCGNILPRILVRPGKTNLPEISNMSYFDLPSTLSQKTQRIGSGPRSPSNIIKKNIFSSFVMENVLRHWQMCFFPTYQTLRTLKHVFYVCLAPGKSATSVMILHQHMMILHETGLETNTCVDSHPV